MGREVFGGRGEKKRWDLASEGGESWRRGVDSGVRDGTRAHARYGFVAIIRGWRGSNVTSSCDGVTRPSDGRFSWLAAALRGQVYAGGSASLLFG